MMAFTGSGIRIIVLDEQQKLLSSLRSVVSELIESFTEISACISFLEQQLNNALHQAGIYNYYEYKYSWH